jgi:hypothetical protein
MPPSRRVRGAFMPLPLGVLSRVRLAPGQVARAGVRTLAVGYTRPVPTLTTVGFVGFDES